MSSKPDPERIDEENPEWTDEIFRRARPARQVLVELFPQNVVAEMLRPKRGRPPRENPKQSITIRLSPEVITSFRATGKGWQTRIDDALREWLKSHDPVPREADHAPR